MKENNWKEKLLKFVDPDFKPRWEVFDSILEQKLNSNSIWIDLGSGDNSLIKTFSRLTEFAVGVDILKAKSNKNFVAADIKNLPFKPNVFDVLTLRFVVEHFNSIDNYFFEFSRITKNKGKIIIITTNLLSPIIFLPRIFLTQKLRERIITKLFKVDSNDVFPAFHKINTAGKFKKINDFKIKEIHFISDLNMTRSWIFLLYLIFHLITEIKFLNKYKSNLLVVLEKK